MASRTFSRILLLGALLGLLALAAAQRSGGGGSGGGHGSSGHGRWGTGGQLPDECTKAREVATSLHQMSKDDPQYKEALSDYLDLARTCRKKLKDQRKKDGGGSSGARPTVPSDETPLSALELLARLDPKAQNDFLKKFGDQMVKRGAANCNIFGGEEACKDLSKSSKFARMCYNHPLKVDCAFYDESLEEINDDPTEDLEHEVAEQGEEKCDGCTNNLRELYCAQTVPKCGTFKTHLQTAVLPALTQIVAAKESGGDYVEVAAGLMPNLVQATALTGPCRRFCEAITSSCSCNVTRTFGQMISSLQRNNNQFLEALPGALQQKLFQKLYDQPLCSLYAQDTAPGFSGHCPANVLTYQQCKWCDDNSEVPLFVEEYLADSLLNGVFGWLIGPDGLLQEGDELEGDDEEDFDREGDGNDKRPSPQDADADTAGGDPLLPPAAGGGRKHGKNLALTIFLWLFGLVVVFGGAAAGVVFYRKRQEQQAMRYTGLGNMAGEYGEYAAPDMDSI